MRPRHQKQGNASLARNVEIEISSIRHAMQVETIMNSSHMARDVGLDCLQDRPKRHRPWFLPF